MLLAIVTDEELAISQIVKTILLILISTGILLNLLRISRHKTGLKRAINLVLLLFLSTAFYFVFWEYKVEASLLKHPQYVSGITRGYCSVFAKGKGIEFEYEVNGIVFRKCNTFHPVVQDSITVPGGQYLVRYSTRFPDAGRMDFRKKAE